MPARGHFPLEPDREAMREALDLAARKVIEHIATLGEQPAADVEGARELARSLRGPLPERGTDLAELLDLVVDRLAPKSFNAAGPGYLAFIPGGGLFHSALADLVAGALNRYTGVWAAAPALVELEANVIRWFGAMLGYPGEARGYLSSGGSLANFTAVVTARRDRLPEDFLRGTLYTSDQTHHSVLKAATLAGFPEANVRTVASDAAYRLRLDALAEAIAADRRRGFAPFLVVGCAGTTNTGAVDDLAALARLAADEGLWLHVDAAYGGFFALTERGRALFRGIERADSITLDPHKGLFLPYGTGCLLVRDGSLLARAHRMDADYLLEHDDGDEWYDFSTLSPELSRPFRGLGVWLPLELHGIAPFREALDEKLDLALLAADGLRAIEGIRIVAEPQLSIVAFGLDGRGLRGEELDRLNLALLERINARRRVYLTGTRLGGRFVLRICVLSFRTHEERLRMALEDVGAAVAELPGR